MATKKRAAAPRKKAAAKARATSKKAPFKKAVKATLTIKKKATKKPKKKAAQTTTKSSAKTVPQAELVNHVAFVVDRSGSMAPISARIVEIFNDQLLKLKLLHKTSNQQTFVSLFTFSTAADEPRIHALPVSGLRPLKRLRCEGMTALFDATGKAIDELRSVGDDGDPAVSFLVIVLTDGHENSSTLYRTKLPALISSRQKTGRWTFAFLVPTGGVAACQRLGIPDENVQPWTTTTAGVDAMGRAMNRCVERFYAARAKGERSTLRVFPRRALRPVATGVPA